MTKAAASANPSSPVTATPSRPCAPWPAAKGRLGVVVTGLLGFALAAAFVLTDSLLVVVVAHYVVNAVEFVAVEGLDLRSFG